MSTNIQKLIEEALYVRKLQAGSTDVRRLPRGAVVADFIDYGSIRKNSFWNQKVYVKCGGCGGLGVTRVKDPLGARTKEKRKHADCQGSGWRPNRRYGRCG